MTEEEMRPFIDRADLMNIKLADDTIIRASIAAVHTGTVEVREMDGTRHTLSLADIVVVTEG